MLNMGSETQLAAKAMKDNWPIKLHDLKPSTVDEGDVVLVCN